MRAGPLAIALFTASAAPAWAQQPAPAARWGQPPPTAPGPWPVATQPGPGAAPFGQGSAPGAAPFGQGQPGGATPLGPSETARQLDAAEREDSGRGLEWFWAQAEGGVHYVGLEAIDGRDLLLEGQKGSAAAPIAGLALGGRVVFFTVGAHARVAFLPVGQLGTLNLEGGYHIPLGNFEPYVQIGAGYARLFGADRPAVAAETPAVQGFDARLGGGFDYYLAPQFSLGLLANVELLWLWRSGVRATAEAAASEDPATQRAAARAARDGSSVGVATGLVAVAGLHF
ncbi:MAG TPA: hypothetical protein VFS43_31465 [Polyangiaceae bacterium]|nr:hypothetical protein [Polyangiaceae bacterium]